MSKSPAFQFYPTDYLADGNVALMSLEQEGAYIRLLCFCWNEGSIPDDVESLARYCRVDSQKMSQLWNGIKNCFKPMKNFANKLIHPRLEEEKKKQRKRKQQQRDNAKSRWSKERSGDATALPTECQPALPSQCSSSPSSSPSSLDKLPPTPKGESEGFKKFWDLYPKKTTKQECIEYWRKAKLDNNLPEILKGLDAWKKNDQWTKDEGKFIPDPIRWLKKARWTDEITQTSQVKKTPNDTVLDAITNGLPIREKAKTWVVYQAGDLLKSDTPGYAIIKAERRLIALGMLEVIRGPS
jgi:uncharacterized protein YdaU (DUF1376 family)